jgi:hypothetical protein
MEPLGLDHSLESCFQFVRLHGWCDQTHQKIDEVLAELRRRTPEQTALIEPMIDRLRALGSVEERLFCLVVLERLGVPVSKIAELTLQVLKNQISENDLAFLSRYFFDGGYPLPAPIVADITKGNFFTYKRAIYQAMAITELASDYSGAHVLLFLVQLLCRNSLNEQNRAILYVLLSRIDVDRPPGLAAIVRSAMQVLAGLVREVAERGQAVLADRLDPGERAVAEALTALSALTDPKPSAAEKEAPVRRAAAVRPEVDDISTKIEVIPNKKSSSQKSRPVASPSNPPDPASLEERPASENRPRWSPSQTQTVADTPEPNDDWLQRSALNPNAKTSAGSLKSSDPVPAPSGPTMADYDTGEAPATTPGTLRQSKRFLIRFDRDSEEVKQLLEEEPSPVTSPRHETEPVRAEKKSPRQKRSALSIGRRYGRAIAWVALALIAAAAAWFIWSLTLSHKEIPHLSMPAPSSTATAPGPELHPDSTGWSPRPGESLWTWYLSLHSQPGQAGGDLSQLTWPQFVERVLKMNPQLVRPDLIYPGKELQLKQ